MAKKIKKADVIEIFGTVKNLAEAVGIVSQGISRWPAVLQDYHINEVISAAWRIKNKTQLTHDELWIVVNLKAIGVKVERRGGDL
jgi:hypothetical protein